MSNEIQLETKQVINIPQELLTHIKEVSDYFGYDFNTVAAKNCIKVGIINFKKDKEQFRKLLSEFSLIKDKEL